MKISKPYHGKIEDLGIVETAKGGDISKRVVFGPGKFWDDYVMRVFTIKPGASSPCHSHDWPHYVIFLQGKAEVKIGDAKFGIEKGCYVFVPSNEEHTFLNVGNEDMTFICIVPAKGDNYTFESVGK